MNTYKIIFLSLILLQFVFNLVLKLLSSKQASKPLPASVQGIYDESEYNKWRSYQNKKDKLGLISGIISLVINLALFGTNLISIIYNAMPGNGVMIKSILFFLVVGLVETIVSLPIEYVFNFKIWKI